MNHRGFFKLGLATLIILFLVLLGSRLSSTVDENSLPTMVFGVGGHWKLEIALTEEARALGLGERDVLPAGQAMLFLFPRADYPGFWMKGMRFPIDIVYLRAGKIISIERHFDPSDERVVFPTGPADQVLEVNAGEADRLAPGDRLWYWRNW